MGTNRQDAWTKEEDMLLAEVTLRSIREGGTQLSAFEEAGRILGRTPNACGFRWNSAVRKAFTNEIREAKSARIKRGEKSKIPQEEKVSGERNSGEEKELSFDAILSFLQSHRVKVHEMENEMIVLRMKAEELYAEKVKLMSELDRLLSENKHLKDENLRLNDRQCDLSSPGEDYKIVTENSF